MDIGFSLKFMSSSKRLSQRSESPVVRKLQKASSSSCISSNVSTGENLCFQPSSFHSSRIKYLTVNKSLKQEGAKCILVWMTRDQRCKDNYTLLCAQELSHETNLPIRVVFNLVPKFLQATIRQYDFMINGLKHVENDLNSVKVRFHLAFGDPTVTVPSIAEVLNAAVVLTDFSPLRVNRVWVQAVADALDSKLVPLIQVDSHNIIPVWIASNKLEYSARTLRSKIEKLLTTYLKPFPDFLGNSDHPSSETDVISEYERFTLFNATNSKYIIDWDAALASLEIDRTVPPVEWIKPGEVEAFKMLESFGEARLKNYAEKRNNPNEANALSNLSPYFHFGQLSVQRAVLFVKELRKFPNSTDAFIEESVVRRELADNFCYCKY